MKNTTLNPTIWMKPIFSPNAFKNANGKTSKDLVFNFVKNLISAPEHFSNNFYI